MASSSEKNEKDFFELISQADKVEDPFAAGEILFKDKQGNLKILKDGQVQEYSPEQQQINQAVVAVKEPIKPKSQPAAPAKFAAVPSIVHTQTNYDKEVAAVAKEVGIHFNDSEMENRFKNIVKSRLKGVRSQVQTREVFLASMLEGGMGFDAEHTENILEIVAKHAGKHHDAWREQVSVKPFSNLQAEAQQLLTNPDDMLHLDLPDQEPALVITPQSANEITKKQIKINDQVEVKPVKPVLQQTPTERQDQVVAPIARVIPKSDSSKIKINDVKFTPKLTGPVEEIGNMTIKDFRRLSTDPHEAIKKIIEKINLLEEESFTRRTQAIAAWKRSPINTHYLHLGDMSMEEKKPIAEIIAEVKNAGQQTLTEEEIDAIIELNKKLRY